MLRPLFLTRASIGLAATAVEGAVALPGRAAGAAAALPGLPVKLAGSVLQAYLHAGQTLTELAVKGDTVLATVFPAESDQPEWATFDEDLDPDGSGPVGESGGGPDVPTGRVTPRNS